MPQDFATRPDHKNYVQSLIDPEGLRTWKSFTDVFWNTKPLGAADRTEFLFRRGFLRDRWALYDLSEGTEENYLSDLQALHLLGQGDRLQALRSLAEANPDTAVRVHAVRGVFAREAAMTEVWQAHLDRPEEAADLTVQALPVSVRLGGRSEMFEIRQGQFDGGGKTGSIERLYLIVRDWSNAARLPYLYVDWPTPGGMMKDLHPSGATQLCVALVRDPKAEGLTLYQAAMLIGSDHAGAGTAMARGALSAPVDVNTGQLDQAVRLEGSELTPYATHPETQAPIAGCSLPNWSAVAAEIEHCAEVLPKAPLIVLNVILDTEGRPRVLGPASADLSPLQVHAPLLRDPYVAQLLVGRMSPEKSG